MTGVATKRMPISSESTMNGDADRAEPLPDRGPDHVAVHRERERVVGAVGQLRLALQPRPHLDARGTGLEVGIPRREAVDRAPVGLLVEVDVLERAAAEAFGRLGDLELVRSRARRGTARRGSRGRCRARCRTRRARGARACRRRGGRPRPATRCGRRGAPRRRSSTGPGGTGARKIALAVTSVSSGRPSASCIARSAVYIVTPPNTYTTFQLSGMSAWKRPAHVGIGRERGVGAQVAGAFGHRVSLGSRHDRRNRKILLVQRPVEMFTDVVLRGRRGARARTRRRRGGRAGRVLLARSGDARLGARRARATCRRSRSAT